MSSPLLIPLVYFAAVLETWLAPRWEVAGAAPDLLVLVAFAWLACSAGQRGIVVAALIGLLSDLGSSAPLGLGMATFAVVAFSVVWLRRRLTLDRLPGRLGVIWYAATSTTLVEGIVLRLIGHTPLPWRMLIERGALVGLYTTAVALPVLIVVGWRSDRPTIRNLLAEG